MEVGLVAQRNNDDAARLVTSLAEALVAEGAAVAVDEETADAVERAGTPVDEMDGCDLVVSIGGDGTFLFAARRVGETPILGVNLGEVGFLNAVVPDEAVETVTAVVERIRETGDADAREVDRLRASGDDWTLEPALNEVVVHGPRRGHGGGVDATVVVDGERYARGHADGVLVATPTGSTAYNLSERGPLVRPTVDALVVTGMAPASGTPPLVIDGSSTVTVRLTGADRAYAISDGRNERALEPPTSVTISRADDPVRLAGPPVNFFEALEKLE